MNFLSWLKSTDVYDPDRLASDEEAIRRYYMKNGYADFQITNTDVAYQANPPGYVITITMEEGPQYHVSSVSVVSNIPKVDGPALNRFVALRPGDVYDASSVDKSVEAITRDVARQGYAFSEARPHGERDTANHTIAISFSVDNGPKVYIERIDIVGNTRTRDYVIRREFDIGEGDPYNHVTDRAGRATPQQPRLLQEGPHLEPAGVRAGSGDRGRRGGGPADRLDQPQRRLFDDPGRFWPSSPIPRRTFSAAASMCA